MSVMLRPLLFWRSGLPPPSVLLFELAYFKLPLLLFLLLPFRGRVEDSGTTSFFGDGLLLLPEVESDPALSVLSFVIGGDEGDAVLLETLGAVGAVVSFVDEKIGVRDAFAEGSVESAPCDLERGDFGASTSFASTPMRSFGSAPGEPLKIVFFVFSFFRNRRRCRKRTARTAAQILESTRGRSSGR